MCARPRPKEDEWQKARRRLEAVAGFPIGHESRKVAAYAGDGITVRDG